MPDSDIQLCQDSWIEVIFHVVDYLWQKAHLGSSWLQDNCLPRCSQDNCRTLESKRAFVFKTVKIRVTHESQHFCFLLPIERGLKMNLQITLHERLNSSRK